MSAIRIIRDCSANSNSGVSSNPLQNLSDIVMGMNLFDKEEQFKLVSEVVLESLRDANTERINNCLHKMREIIFADEQQLETLVSFDRSLHLSTDPINAHGDFEISRILDLLDD